MVPTARRGERKIDDPRTFLPPERALGGGRRMSRTAATKAFTEADPTAQTAGVVCGEDRGVLDEIPGA
jgi:hypothetical protein